MLASSRPCPDRRRPLISMPLVGRWTLMMLRHTNWFVNIRLDSLPFVPPTSTAIIDEGDITPVTPGEVLVGLPPTPADLLILAHLVHRRLFRSASQPVHLISDRTRTCSMAHDPPAVTPRPPSAPAMDQCWLYLCRSAFAPTGHLLPEPRSTMIQSRYSLTYVTQ